MSAVVRKVRMLDEGYGALAAYRCCPKCARWLPQTTAHFIPRRRDSRRRVVGWQSYCRPCKTAVQRARPAIDPAKSKLYTERWFAKLKADPEAYEAYKARNAASQRERARANRERQREINRNYRARISADPERLAEYNEVRRISSRLRQERRGRPLSEQGTSPTTTVLPRDIPRYVQDPEAGGFVLAAPLAAAIQRRITLEGGDVERACRLVGIADRQFRDWRDGVWKYVSLDTADRALLGLGLHWWDVWTDEGAELAQRAFEGVEAA